MGSSFVNIKEQGFWVSDGLLEVWLLSLAREIDFAVEPPSWLVEARQYWYHQATGGFTGCISPDLNSLIISEDRRQEITKISEQALISLLDGNTERDIKIEYWAGFNLTDTTLNTFLSDWQASSQINLLKTAKQFIKLLRGEVTSVASDAGASSWISE